MAGLSVSRLFCLRDGPSGLEFLVDTGAEVSVFPATALDLRSARQDRTLRAANGTLIRTFGKRSVSFNVNSRRYSWDFVVADVRRPLLGTDFLCHYGLLVDVKGRRLVDGATFSVSALQETFGPSQRIFAVSAATPFVDLLAQCPDLTTPTFSRPTTAHGVEHFIPTTGPPIHSRARRLSPDKLALAKAEF